MDISESQFAAEILAQYTDTASAHFDEALGALVIDEAQRRELRYWQRQSLAALRQYAGVALPGALAAVATAKQEALDSVAAAAQVWAAARPTTAADATESTPDPLELRRRSVAARLASGA